MGATNLDQQTPKRCGWVGFKRAFFPLQTGTVQHRYRNPTSYILFFTIILATSMLACCRISTPNIYQTANISHQHPHISIILKHQIIQSLQTSNMEQRPLSHIHQTSIYISTYLNCPVSQASTPLNPSSKPRSPCSSHWCFATVSFHSFVVKRHEATKPRGLNQEKLWFHRKKWNFNAEPDQRSLFWNWRKRTCFKPRIEQ